MRIDKSLLGAMALLSMASSCSRLAGPEYQPPEVPVKEQWSAESSNLGQISPNWWSEFGDPNLDGLIEAAVGGNIDLQVAAGRIERAQALVQATGARRLPGIGLSGGAEYGLQSSGGGATSSTETYQLGTSLSWEIDIWGKLQKGVAAAEAEYKASGADWRSAYLVLVSETAGEYFRLRQIDEQIHLYQRSIANSERTLSLYLIRAEENYVGRDTVLRQQAEVRRLQRELQDLERQRKIAENSLAVLTGKPPGELSIGYRRVRDQLHPVEVPAGLPADLLSRRPDILAAEYRVLAVYNLVGKARLDRLPSISLTASGGSASASIGNLLSQWVLGVGPVISLPILDPGRQAEVEVREADLKIASDQYRSVVIKAFQEVEDVLISLSSRRIQQGIADQAVSDLQKVREISSDKLEEGLISQLEVLETERSLLQSEQVALSIHFLLLNDTVTLFKALGGGWDDSAMPTE